MREGWEIKTLGEVIKLEYGKPLPKEYRDVNGRYPAYGANGEKCRTDKFYWEKPSIIVGRKGSAGEIRLSAERFWPLDVTYFVTFDDNKYDLFFLYHCLESLQLTKLAKGVKPGINRNDVYQLEFCFPPLTEQKRIVGVLDETFAAIGVAAANTQKNLANARELFETTLNDIFTQKGEGWVEKRLGEITTKIGSGATPKGGSSSYKSVGISLIRSLNVHDRSFKEKKLAFIDESQAEKLSNVIVEAGDVLFNITGASIARCCIVPSEFLPARVNQHVSILRPKKDQISTEFLCYLMISRRYKGQLLGIGGDGGSTRQAITKKQLQDLNVTVPKNIEVQNSIVLKLDNLASQTQHLKTIYQQKLDDLTELKQSILQKAFAGELTASNVVAFPKTLKADEPVDTTSPAFNASVICFAWHLHAKQKRDKTFGRVKAEKTRHLTESIGRVSLGREEYKGRHGPNDSAHMRRAENWAKDQQFFEFVKRPEGKRGYDFIKLARYDEMKTKAFTMIKPYRDRLEKIINLLIPMDTEQAEVFATVHAAWNNLIIDGVEITDDAIIHEATENWHPEKLNILISKFKTALLQIKQKNLQPDGTAKYVGKQHEVLF